MAKESEPTHRVLTTVDAVGLAPHLTVTHTNVDPWGPAGSTVDVTSPRYLPEREWPSDRACGCLCITCPECAGSDRARHQVCPLFSD